MADENDPLGFLDQGSMSQQEREALAMTTGGANPTLEPVVTTTAAEPASTAAAPAVAETPKTPAATPEKFEDDGTGHTVPLTVLLTEREKRQNLQRQLDERNARDAEVEQDQALTFDPPDPAKDAAGYARYQAGMTNLAILNERMNFSERFAREKHGDDVVQTAHDWAVARFKADPAYEESVMRSSDPYATIVRDHTVQTRGEQVDDDDWKAFHTWKAAQNGGGEGQGGASDPPKPAAAAPAAVPQAQAKKIPAQSIADLPGAGGGQHTVPVGAGQAFDNVFTR